MDSELYRHLEKQLGIVDASVFADASLGAFERLNGEITRNSDEIEREDLEGIFSMVIEGGKEYDNTPQGKVLRQAFTEMYALLDARLHNNERRISYIRGELITYREWIDAEIAEKRLSRGVGEQFRTAVVIANADKKVTWRTANISNLETGLGE